MSPLPHSTTPGSPTDAANGGHTLALRRSQTAVGADLLYLAEWIPPRQTIVLHPCGYLNNARKRGAEKVDGK